MDVFLVILFAAFSVAQAFWSYKLRRFFRIFSGAWAGLLISFTTGYLIFMDGMRGDIVRHLSKPLANLVDGNDIFGLLLQAAKDGQTRDLLLEVLPDSAKAFLFISVLACIACAVVSSMWEKPGVFLELFAYGYIFAAGVLASMESSLLGAVVGIITGALLGALGYKISRGWIIVAPNVMDFFVLSQLLLLSMPASGSAGGGGASAALSLLLLLLMIAIPIGVFKQFRSTAARRDGGAQPDEAPSARKGRWDSWGGKFKTAAAQFSARADSAAGSAPEKAPPAGGKKFCSQCGAPLNPDAKFCPQCGRAAKN